MPGCSNNGCWIENKFIGTRAICQCLAPLGPENEQALKHKISTLQSNLRTAIKWMEWWLDQNECECEDGLHHCGRTERLKELQSMKKALEL